MIARTWRGWTARADAAAYLEYLHKTGLSAYAKVPGNQGVLAARRDKDWRAEFVVVSLWDSTQGIRRFAGDSVDRAVFYPQDDNYLVDRETHVDHFDVVFKDVRPTALPRENPQT